MSSSDRQGIIARLWSYVCLIPQDLSAAYALHAELPPHQDTLWLELLFDLSENRLTDAEVQRRYLGLFPNPAEAPAAMRALQSAWCAPRMAVLRGQMEKDIRALKNLNRGRAVVPAGAPGGSGSEGAAAEGRVTR